MEKTAVEWFEQQLDDLDIEIPFSIFEEAKEIEKEQHEETWHNSRIEDMGDNYLGKQVSFNEYYNEKFNKDENK